MDKNVLKSLGYLLTEHEQTYNQHAIKGGKTQELVDFKSIRNSKEWRTVETTEEKNKCRFMSNGSLMA